MAQAVVTGATGGIGQAVTLALRARGYEVLALGRDPDVLAALAAQGVVARAVDLSDPSALPAVLEGWEPEVLVNNAGMMPPLAPFQNLDPAMINHAVAVNLTSALHLTRALLPAMCARGRGHVFFTGSTAGHAPFANLALYCATKAALGGFAQALRLDLAPFGLRVTEIVAGRVETGLYRDLLGKEARAAMYAGQTAVQPDDVARMLVAVLEMPPHVDVARFDILPTWQTTPTGAQKGNAK